MKSNAEVTDETFREFQARASKAAHEISKMDLDNFSKHLLSYKKFEDLRFLVELWHLVDCPDGDVKREAIIKRTKQIRISLGMKA